MVFDAVYGIDPARILTTDESSRVRMLLSTSYQVPLIQSQLPGNHQKRMKALHDQTLLLPGRRSLKHSLAPDSRAEKGGEWRVIRQIGMSLCMNNDL